MFTCIALKILLLALDCAAQETSMLYTILQCCLVLIRFLLDQAANLAYAASIPDAELTNGMTTSSENCESAMVSDNRNLLMLCESKQSQVGTLPDCVTVRLASLPSHGSPCVKLTVQTHNRLLMPA